jgi:hypothetical protein
MKQAATFCAVGEIVLYGTMANDMRRHGADWLLQEMAPVLKDADVLLGSFVTLIIPPDFPEPMLDPLAIATRLDFTEPLARAGFDALNLANNHVLDVGTLGMFHTQKMIEARGMLAIGVGATQKEARRLRLLERSGLTWGFLAYAEDSNYTLSTSGPCHAYYEPNLILEDIHAARSEVDVLVVSVHADLEFSETPSVRRCEAFRAFARAGATLVLGTHPHVPQGVERVGNSLIAFSLGNFAFHAHTSPYLSAHLPNTARSFVLQAEISRQGVEAFRRIPIVIDPPPNQRPRPATASEARDIDLYLKTLDEMVADDFIVAAKWRATAVRYLISTLQQAGTRYDEKDALHLIGELLFVAENRAWVDEIKTAAAEMWSQQRHHVDLHRRPSYASTPQRPPDRASLMQRAARKLRRTLLSR